MREGYIVWNLSNYDCEFFGVYKNPRRALTQFRKVIRNRYGRCPRKYEDILEFLSKVENGDDSLRISHFVERSK